MTLSEFLKVDKNQAFTLGRVIEILRKSGSWGKRGLFAEIANATSFSAAYVGQLLTGKKPLTDEFVCKIAVYLNVSVTHLRGEESIYGNTLKEEIVGYFFRNPDKPITPDRIYNFVNRLGFIISETEIEQLLPEIEQDFSEMKTIRDLAKKWGIYVSFDSYEELRQKLSECKPKLLKMEAESAEIDEFDALIAPFDEVRNRYDNKDIPIITNILQIFLESNAAKTIIEALLPMSDEKRVDALTILQREGIIPPTTDPKKES